MSAVPERLELFHAERKNPLHYVLAGAALMGFLTFPAQLIELYFAPEPEKPARQAQPSPAPIWSKRCTSRGQDFIAHQADGGQWIVRCVGKPART